MRFQVCFALMMSVLSAPAALGQAGQAGFGQPGFGQAGFGQGAPNEFNSWHPSHPYPRPTYPNTAPNAIHRHSSTALEGYLRGRAAVSRAYTDGMLSLAQARILMAEARARELQLRVINTRTYLERKQMLQEMRDAERLYKLERKEQNLALRQKREATELYATYRLPMSVLNPATGEIVWPETLAGSGLVDMMQDLELLFSQLASEGAQSDRFYRDPIIDHVSQMRRRLWDLRKELGLTHDDYFAAQKLLIGLKYEAENWPSSQDARVAAAW